MTRSPRLPAMQLTIAFEKPEYVAGEPISAMVQVTNIGTGGGRVPGHVEPEFGLFRYFVQPEAGEERPFVAATFSDWAGGWTQLAPGQSTGAVAKLFFGAEGWTFERPGSYRVRVTGPGGTEAAASFKVVPPRTPLEAQQAGLFLNEEVGRFLLRDGGDHLETAARNLERVQSLGGPSILRAHAALALGINLARGQTDLATGRVRPPDLARASQLLEWSEARFAQASYPLQQARVNKQLVDTYGLLGSKDRAQAAIERFEKQALGFAMLKNIDLDRNRR